MLFHLNYVSVVHGDSLCFEAGKTLFVLTDEVLNLGVTDKLVGLHVQVCEA